MAHAPAADPAPVVVVLPPLGAEEDEMAPLVDALRSRWPTADVTVCVRPGGAGFEADLEQAREAFRAAVGSPGGSEPVIVVGASYGGMVARLALLQLLDERGPTQLGAASRADGGQVKGDRVSGDQVVSPGEDSRPVGLVLLDSPHEDSHALIRAYVGEEAAVELPNPEGVDLPAALQRLRRECPAGVLGRTPLIVLSRAEGTWAGDHWALGVAESLWLNGQRRLALLSRTGRCEVVDGSGHAIWREAPSAVVDAVGRLNQDVQLRR